LAWGSRWKGALTVAVVGLLVASASAVPAAKAKRKGGGSVEVTQQVNSPIPDGSVNFMGADGVVVSTIDVGKRLKGKRIRDVNVTFQTIGNTGTDYPLDFFDLGFFLVAPNGATTRLLDWISGGNIGPLTLDDESNKALGGQFPSNPFQLPSPHIGTARPGEPLAVMDGGPVRGRWTLVALDQLANPPAVSTLVSWKLSVVAGKPYRTK
jgi:hypothetical protein